MAKRDGTYEGPDAWAVRVRTLGADRGGSARSEWRGSYPEQRARATADRLAKERGGRVTEDKQCLTVLVPTGNRGGRPATIENPVRIVHYFPRDLVNRLDESAKESGTTRSDLLRRAAELLLSQPDTEQ